MLPGIGPETALLLVGIALVGGVGITTIGPGGIFVTAALFLLTPLSSAEVAGTAHVTFIATGLVGTAAYRHSGELRSEQGRHLAVILAISSVLGALAGAQVNTFLARETFGALLGVAAAVTGGLLVRRQVAGLQAAVAPNLTDGRGRFVLGALGFVLGLLAGLLGVGGPVIAVPALVLLGVPMLLALAVAQVQSILISTFATVGYLFHGAVAWWVVVLVGVPQLVGVWLGWRVAHLIDPEALTLFLGAVLVGLGGYLLWP